MLMLDGNHFSEAALLSLAVELSTTEQLVKVLSMSDCGIVVHSKNEGFFRLLHALQHSLVSRAKITIADAP